MKIRFRDLEVGCQFRVNDIIYMKTEVTQKPKDSTCCLCTYNAIGISKAMFFSFNGSRMVTKLEDNDGPTT
jgi:thiol:disulfide interchange protein